MKTKLKVHTIGEVKSLVILVQRQKIGVPNKLLYGIKNILSILFVTAIISIISGFLMWCVEQSYNKTFQHQIFNGIWWSQVTMTTTGYGDCVPKTGFGKALAILIMFCGTFLVALTTSTVIDAITDSSQFHLQKNMKVAVVKDTYEEMVVERDYEGIPYQYESYEEVYTAVEKGEIQIGLVTKYIAAWDINAIKRHTLAVVYEFPAYFPVSFVSYLPTEFDKYHECAYGKYGDETKLWTQRYFHKHLAIESYYMPNIEELISDKGFFTTLSILSILFIILGLALNVHSFVHKKKKGRFEIPPEKPVAEELHSF